MKEGRCQAVKLEGGANDLIQRIVDDPAFPLTEEEIYAELDPKRYIGRCASQVEELVAYTIQPILQRWHDGEIQAELKV